MDDWYFHSNYKQAYVSCRKRSQAFLTAKVLVDTDCPLSIVTAACIMTKSATEQ